MAQIAQRGAGSLSLEILKTPKRHSTGQLPLDNPAEGRDLAQNAPRSYFPPVFPRFVHGFRCMSPLCVLGNYCGAESFHTTLPIRQPPPAAILCSAGLPARSAARSAPGGAAAPGPARSWRTPRPAPSGPRGGGGVALAAAAPGPGRPAAAGSRCPSWRRRR